MELERRTKALGSRADLQGNSCADGRAGGGGQYSDSMYLASHRWMSCRLLHVLLPVLACVSLLSCRTPGGSTPGQKRAATLEMRNETLAALFRARPSARSELSRAPGYAVFANISSKILLVGVGNGYGVVTDNRSGRRTYMRMIQGGAGWGLGIKKFRVVIVFRTSFGMQDFVRLGWTFKGDAEATAKIESFGGGIGQSLVLGNMRIYTLDEAGLSLTAMVQGTKFYVDSDLN